MLRLAVTGPAYSGKTTLARELEAGGFQLLNYTDLLKTYLSEALTAVGVEVSVDDILADKEKYRALLIEFGAAIGFDEGFGVERMLEQIDPAATGVVFDCVRFPAQWDKLKAAGFTLLRLTTQQQFRESRAIAQGMCREDYYAMADNRADQDIPVDPDEIRLHVAGPIEDVLNELTVQVVARALCGYPLRETPDLRKRAPRRGK